MQQLNILFVHGVGHQSNDLSWQSVWKEAVQDTIARLPANVAINAEFAMLDGVFEQYPLQAEDIWTAIQQLGGSGIGSLFRRRRGLFDQIYNTAGWTAGMVTQWVAKEEIRQQTREIVHQKITEFKPDVICAHSLGSLVCYDLFTSNEGKRDSRGRTFISFGSQINNPFVIGTFAAGRLTPIDARRWYHLYNPNDRVFTSEIRLTDPNFLQIEAEFSGGFFSLNHDAIKYLGHVSVKEMAWAEVVNAPQGTRTLSLPLASYVASREPDRKALLVGINDYPDPANRLEGCVNDVFLMSSVLQNCGFAPDDIRIVLNERATAAGILDRLNWLLGDTQAGDQRFFFYSGHGAQIPKYGSDDEPDHLDECLVPYDFDWRLETTVSDDQFYQLYSQLPYDSYFVAMFDCCHSGGLARDGSQRAKSITPPDDIRHRLLKWNIQEQMWEPRDLKPINSNLGGGKDTEEAYLGDSGASQRLFRAAQLRLLPSKEYDEKRKERGHYGPYLPVILEACQEDEFAYEYRHGVISYGAFTFMMAHLLNFEAQQVGKSITFHQLIEKATTKLAELNYQQTPALLGPKKIIDSNIPWKGANPPKPSASTGKKRKKKR